MVRESGDLGYARAITREVAVIDDLHALRGSARLAFRRQPGLHVTCVSSFFVFFLATLLLLLHRGVNFSVMSARKLGHYCSRLSSNLYRLRLRERFEASYAATTRRAVVPHRLAILIYVRAAPPSARGVEREECRGWTGKCARRLRMIRTRH